MEDSYKDNARFDDPTTPTVRQSVIEKLPIDRWPPLIFDVSESPYLLKIKLYFSEIRVI